MPRQRTLDDASVEAVLRGRTVAPELEALAEVVIAIRTAAARPVQPSRELADRMAAGVFTHRRDRRTKAGRTFSTLAAMSVRAKVATGCAVALTGLTGVSAAGAFPDAAQERLETAIESVTPFEFPEQAEFGQEVAENARDGGVDGQEISERARELGQQPTDPGSRGQADEHRPDGPPADLPTSDRIPAEASENRPDPDRPGADPTGRPDELPADVEGRPSVPSIPS